MLVFAIIDCLKFLRIMKSKDQPAEPGVGGKGAARKRLVFLIPAILLLVLLSLIAWRVAILERFEVVSEKGDYLCSVCATRKVQSDFALLGVKTSSFRYEETGLSDLLGLASACDHSFPWALQTKEKRYVFGWSTKTGRFYRTKDDWTRPYGELEKSGLLLEAFVILAARDLEFARERWRFICEDGTHSPA